MRRAIRSTASVAAVDTAHRSTPVDAGGPEGTGDRDDVGPDAPVTVVRD